MYDYQGAIKAGANPDDVVKYLAQQTGYNAAGAIKAGANQNDVLAYMAKLPTKSAPAAPASPNIAQRVTADTNAHAANIVDDLSQKPNLTGAVDVLGNVAGEVGDFLGEPIKSLYQTAVPQGTRDSISGAIKSVAGTPAATSVIKAWNDFQAQHPDAAKNIGNAVNIAALFGGDAASPTVDEATQTVKEGAGKTASLIKTAVTPNPEKASLHDLQDAIEVVRPKLTPTEEAAAKASGRGVTSGILKKTVITPSATEVEMGNVAKQAGVSAGNTFDENIQLMKTAQKESAQIVRKGLQDSNAIWNPNELKGQLNQIEEPITVKSDATLRNQSKYLKQGIFKLVSGATKKPEGILDVRQGFDDLVEKEFGKKIFAKDDPIGNLIRSYRQKLNTFAESKIPDGTLPDGKTFKGELRRQSLLYNAIDNVAAKAPKAGESAHPLIGKTVNFAKKHPVVATAAAYGAEKAAKNLGVPLP